MTATQKRKHRTTHRDFMDRLIGDDPEHHAKVDDIVLEMDVGQLLYDAREAAGLTHAALAKRVGTTAAVIEDLEYADYDGHTLPMVRRIAAALHLKVEIRLVPEGPAKKAPPRRRATSARAAAGRSK